MLYALLNDIFQRIIALNKREQKNNLSRRLKSLGLLPKSKILDFGCGTGLFAKGIQKDNLYYIGYDIDERFVKYASFINSSCKFTALKEVVRKEGPFAIILANCCFHHINDLALLKELEDISSLLSQDGILLVYDLLLADNESNLLKRLFRRIERGSYIRSIESYTDIIRRQFKIEKSEIERTHLFSIKRSPIYNDLVIFKCKK